MRKALLLLCALALAFSLSGCATEADVRSAYERGLREGKDIAYDEGYDSGYADCESALKKELRSEYKRGYADGKASVQVTQPADTKPAHTHPPDADEDYWADYYADYYSERAGEIARDYMYEEYGEERMEEFDPDCW